MIETTGKLRELIPDDYDAFMSLPWDERYKLCAAVPYDNWSTYCIPTNYETKTRDGLDVEEREAVIQGLKQCPMCMDTGRSHEIQVGRAQVMDGDKVVSRKAYRSEPIECQCKIWKHVWTQAKREIPSAYHQFSLATLKPDIVNRLPIYAQQLEIDYMRQHSAENFLLLGPPGTGKTTLVCALIRAAYERSSKHFWKPFLGGIEYRDTRWIWRGNFNHMLNQFNAKQWDNDGTVPEPDVTQQKIKDVVSEGFIPTLIIEEVDKLDLNSHRVNFLLPLIDEILNTKGGQLVMTTNLTMDEFRKIFTAKDEIRTTGETIIRRLTHHVNIRNYFEYF